MSADALAERLGLDLPEDRDYATVAGHALWVLKHLPQVGEYFHDQGWRFEIVDMDGRKIDRSEEHTSELQSLMRSSYAVFCLKKKNNTSTITRTTTQTHITNIQHLHI